MLFCINISYASSKIEITAKTLFSKNNIIYAKGSVLVYYDNAIMTSDNASFDKDKKLLILDKNVEIIGYRGTKEHSTHIEIHTDTDEVIFDKLFFVNQNDIWVVTKNAHKEDSNYTFGATVLSSCDMENPIWKMVSSKSKYNKKDNYLEVYNAKLYMLNIPILYTPYMGFSTNRQRSSGFVFPAFGYTQKEGYLYEQPFFWAISDSMDLEINAQTRSLRSVGVYSTFRFVDSPKSKGTIRFGYFKDNDEFVKEYNIKNSEHYGVEFNYNSDDFLEKYLPKGFDDNLYINTTYLNDIDYINLQKTQLTHFGLTPLQESRLNYLINSNDYYLGVNAKYFIDTRKVDNNSTLQILPSIQLHKYLTSLIWDNLTYSVDLKSNRFTRAEGTTLSQYEFRFPLEWTKGFFDNYLNLSLSNEFYYSKYYFANDIFVTDKFRYYSNINRAKIWTDLTKKYKSFVHIMNISLNYIKPNGEDEYPTSFLDLQQNQKELFSVGLPSEQINFSFSQYFYNNSAKLIFYQRFTQSYNIDTNTSHRFSDSTNEMGLNLDRWTFYNNLVYSNEYKKIKESSSRITFNKPNFNFSLGHTYKQNLLLDKDNIIANDINLIFNTNINKKLSINGLISYDLKDDKQKQWGVGFLYHRDCWSFSFYMLQDIIPRPPDSLLPTTENSYLFQLTFIPFGHFGNRQ